MTTRPSPSHLEALLYDKQKRLCHLLEIVPTRGDVLRCTSHDRTLTFEGNAYRPILMGSMSAERREAALRSGNQEATGIVDGDLVTTLDLEGNRFLGAEVRQILVDWRTLRIFGRDRKWIRQIKRTGPVWVATLEGRTQSLQRPIGGPRSGFYHPKCPYRLGDRNTCRKDIGEWTQVDHLVSGTNTTATSLSLTDTTETWIADAFLGYRIVTFGGAVGSGQERAVVANDSDTVEIDEPWDVIPFSCSYRIGLGVEVSAVTRDHYEFEFTDTNGNWIGSEPDDWYRDGTVYFTTGANAGSKHSIAQWVASSKAATILVPTPLPVEVGDTAIIRVGCNGLLSTCTSKFDNAINFGGDPFQPSAQQLIKPPEDF